MYALAALECVDGISAGAEMCGRGARVPNPDYGLPVFHQQIMD